MGEVGKNAPRRRDDAERRTPEENLLHEAQRSLGSLPRDVRVAEASLRVAQAIRVLGDYVDGVSFLPSIAIGDRLEANLAHFFSKYAGIEHSGTPLDGTTIARAILSDLRSLVQEAKRGGVV